jgi:hypothetical protein
MDARRSWSSGQRRDEAGKLLEARGEEVVQRHHGDLRVPLHVDCLGRGPQALLDESVEPRLLVPDLDDPEAEVGRGVQVQVDPGLRPGLDAELVEDGAVLGRSQAGDSPSASSSESSGQSSSNAALARSRSPSPVARSSTGPGGRSRRPTGPSCRPSVRLQGTSASCGWRSLERALRDPPGARPGVPGASPRRRAARAGDVERADAARAAVRSGRRRPRALSRAGGRHGRGGHPDRTRRGRPAGGSPAGRRGVDPARVAGAGDVRLLPARARAASARRRRPSPASRRTAS